MHEAITLTGPDGRRIVATFDRRRNRITVDPDGLKESFTTASWTNPRVLKDGSQATALPKGQFATIQDYERFVVRHEEWHRVLTREADETMGAFESRLNELALAGKRPPSEGGLRQAMRMRNTAAAIHARTVRDFTMLNYSRRYGIDGMAQVIFPYHFWAGRMTKDWMRMTLARPGATAAIVRLYEGAAEMSESADLPDRVKRHIKIPIPFLDDMLTMGLTGFSGTPISGSIYFDPMRMLWPLSSLQDTTNYGPDPEDLTAAGQAFSFAQQTSPFGMNPFMTLGLGATGLLGDRDEFVRRSLSSITQTPLGVPGPRLARAISDYWMGISEDPDPTVLTPEIKAAIAAGQPLEESVLQSTWSEIWDYTSQDGFNDYRINRVIAAMVGEDPERWTPEEGLRALDTRSGPLFQQAKKRAGTEYGLAVLTGWLVMPARLYPEGEAVQRGLDALWRQVRETGDSEKMNAFFELHPEYQVKLAAGASGPEQSERVDTDLYYIDIAETQAKYDPVIDQLRATLEEAEASGYLNSKEGRSLVEVIEADLNYLYDLRQADEERVEALYPDRKTETSLRREPRDRALNLLREQYYAIKPSDYATAAEFHEAKGAFTSQLAAEADPQQNLALAVQAAALWDATADRMAADSSKAGALAQERDKALTAMTEAAMSLISADEFETFIQSGQRPKTQARIEFNQAREEIHQYFAIDKAPGLSPADRRSLQRRYWDEHPLLEKYYGSDELRNMTPEQAAALGTMEQIWEGYYPIEADARRSRDYLAANMDELNEARAQVGLPAIQLINWERVLADKFVQEPTSPMETALANESRTPAERLAGLDLTGTGNR